MKALSLWQPWASLVALGVKSIETRGWSTAYRGPLAIHAAATTKGIDSIVAGEESGWRYAYLGNDGEYQACYCFKSSDEGQRGNTVLSGPAIEIEDEYSVMPLGAIVGTVDLVDVVPMVDAGDEFTGPALVLDGARTSWGQVFEHTEADLFSGPTFGSVYGHTHTDHLCSDQIPFGDYRPGRFAWFLANPRRLTTPVHAKGHQGLWNLTNELDGAR